jgi:hypothetical protein
LALGADLDRTYLIVGARTKVTTLAKRGYQDDAAIITAKILLR